MHRHIFVAGTFDHLHKGHEAVLKAALRKGKKVTIGVTSDTFIAKYKRDAQPYKRRKQKLLEWLGKRSASVIPIHDQFEPAASNPSLTALIVTRHNISRGEEINAKRISRGLAPLVLVTVPMVPARDGASISSTRVRRGEIDLQGRLTLPDALRPELKHPLGKIVAAPCREARTMITCGDMATKTLLDAGIRPTLAIVDYRVERAPYFLDRPRLLATYPHTRRVPSGPGYIAKSVIETLTRWAKHPRPLLFEIVGEEDLVTLPAILCAPVGSIVYYGQPGKGMVEVIVTQKKKKEVQLLLQKFLT